MERSADGYSREFYEWVDLSSTAAARIVVPLVLQLVPVTSVVDVGCGTGGWLRAFADRGVSDLLGLDSERVPLDLLEFDREQFHAVDLTDPLRIDRHFDLAVSLEVAEHLPEASAASFIEFLCSLAPVVLFSAAIPGQEGEGHVNEQWPSYWATRFASHGFESVDVLRPVLWDNEEVDWFYRQNILLYVRSPHRERLILGATTVRLPSPPMNLVHPVTFTSYRTRAERKLSTPLSFSAHVRALPGAFGRAIRRRFGPTGSTR